MSNNQLFEYENYYPTITGGAHIGKRAVMHGRDLLEDLSHLSWVELLFYAIMGKEGVPNRLRILEYIWTGCSYPDPRLWNNRVASLAGSTRSTATLSVAAGMALSEATIYGHRANKKSISAIINAQKAVESGQVLTTYLKSSLSNGKKFYGFGRPVSGVDERIAPTLQRINALEDATLKHVNTALEMERFLKAEKGLQMNITGLSAALAADCGMSPHEYHLFLSPCFVVGIAACFNDALTKPLGAVLPIRCDSIHFTGTPTKKLWHPD